MGTLPGGLCALPSVPPSYPSPGRGWSVSGVNGRSEVLVSCFRLGRKKSPPQDSPFTQLLDTADPSLRPKRPPRSSEPLQRTSSLRGLCAESGERHGKQDADFKLFINNISLFFPPGRCGASSHTPPVWFYFRTCFSYALLAALKYANLK